MWRKFGIGVLLLASGALAAGWGAKIEGLVEPAARHESPSQCSSFEWDSMAGPFRGDPDYEEAVARNQYLPAPSVTHWLDDACNRSTVEAGW